MASTHLAFIAFSTALRMEVWFSTFSMPMVRRQRTPQADLGKALSLWLVSLRPIRRRVVQLPLLQHHVRYDAPLDSLSRETLFRIR